MDLRVKAWHGVAAAAFAVLGKLDARLTALALGTLGLDLRTR